MYDPIYTASVRDIGLILAYTVAGVSLLRLVPWRDIRIVLFALLNIGSAYYFFFYSSENWSLGPFGVLVAVLVLHWSILSFYRRATSHASTLYWMSFLLPILFLAAFKSQSTLLIVGASFMAFRMSLAAFEIRNGRDDFLGLFGYLGFLFFPATFLAGPINPISNHRRSIEDRAVSWHNFVVGLSRILIGYIKFRFMANMVNQLSFTMHWDTGYVMNWGDFLASGAAYYLYLYLNFSGYTDMMIGIAAVMGIKVKENFDNPLLARNVKDFWKRWHLSLTDFVKDAVFTPVTLTLTRSFKGNYVTFASIIAIFCLFATLALWHGTAAGYFLFYGFHFVAFATVQISEMAFRKCARQAFSAYMANPYVIWLARASTFLFLAFTCAFLELKTWDTITSVIGELVSR